MPRPEDIVLNMEEKALIIRYKELAHAMLSGVKFLMETEGGVLMPGGDYGQQFNKFKHLKHGNCLRASEHGALVELLVEKKIFTRREYYVKMNEFMEAEIASFEAQLTERFGHPVTLK